MTVVGDHYTASMRAKCRPHTLLWALNASTQRHKHNENHFRLHSLLALKRTPSAEREFLQIWAYFNIHPQRNPQGNLTEGNLMLLTNVAQLTQLESTFEFETNYASVFSNSSFAIGQDTSHIQPSVARIVGFIVLTTSYTMRKYEWHSARQRARAYYSLEFLVAALEELSLSN